MEDQIRGVPVVDESGRCCGMVAQDDLAQSVESDDFARVVETVSEPSEEE